MDDYLVITHSLDANEKTQTETFEFRSYEQALAGLKELSENPLVLRASLYGELDHYDRDHA